MANNPKKVKDPTEVALSAIQEALNISDASAPEESQGSGRSDGSPSGMPTGTPSFENSDMRPGAGHDRQAFDRQTVDRHAFDEMVPPPLVARRPAKDDRETIGQILQAIQQGRPSRSAHVLAWSDLHDKFAGYIQSDT